MAIKTAEQYRESLKDIHLLAYILGEKGDKVFEHTLACEHCKHWQGVG